MCRAVRGRGLGLERGLNWGQDEPGAQRHPAHCQTPSRICNGRRQPPLILPEAMCPTQLIPRIGLVAGVIWVRRDVCFAPLRAGDSALLVCLTWH